MILLGSVKYSFKLGGITGENHNLFHLGLRALHLILNCLKLTLLVFMTIKASPGWVIPNAHSVTCYDFIIPLSTGFHPHLCYFFRSAGYDWMAQINCLIVRSCSSCVCSSYSWSIPFNARLERQITLSEYTFEYLAGLARFTEERFSFIRLCLRVGWDHFDICW